MINYELAKQLKEAGFPQPEPKFGQVWYADYDNGHMLGRKLLVGTNHFLDVERLEQPMVFCPTFEDIWAQLPDIVNVPEYVNDCPMKARLLQSKHGIYYAYLEKDGRVSQNGGCAYCMYDLPITESAAKLWLTLKEHKLV